MQLPGNLRPPGTGRRPATLHQAARRGDREHVAQTRQAGTRGINALNDRDWDGETALHIAIREGHLPIVRLLVESGADTRLATHGGLRPLHIAAMFGHVDIIKYLASKRTVEVNASTEDGRSALHLALKEQHLDAAETLLAHGAVTGSTLHEVCFWGFQDIAEWLLGRMAQEALAVRDEHNRTPVGRAMDGNHLDLAKHLVTKYSAMCCSADVEELKRLRASPRSETDEAKAARNAKKREKKKRAKARRAGEGAGADTLQNDGDSEKGQEEGDDLGTSTAEAPADEEESLEMATTGGAAEGSADVPRSTEGEAEKEDEAEKDGEAGKEDEADEKERKEAEKEEEEQERDDLTDPSVFVMDCDHLLCPISQDYMTDPVVAVDGNTYQRAALEAWIAKCQKDCKPLTSPLTGLPMSSPELKPNNLVRSLVLEALNKAGRRTPRQSSQGRW